MLAPFLRASPGEDRGVRVSGPMKPSGRLLRSSDGDGTTAHPPFHAVDLAFPGHRPLLANPTSSMTTEPSWKRPLRAVKCPLALGSLRAGVGAVENRGRAMRTRTEAHVGFVLAAALAVSLGLTPAAAGARPDVTSTGACTAASTSLVSSKFHASVKVVTPLEADRTTSIPGGIQTSCTWSGSGKPEAVKLSLFGAGKGGDAQWDAKAEYDVLQPRTSGSPLKNETIKKTTAAVFRPEAGGDRLVVLFKTYVIETESALSGKAGGSETTLIAFAKALIPKVKPKLFTSSKTTPDLFHGADLTLSGAVTGHLNLIANVGCSQLQRQVMGSIGTADYTLVIFVTGTVTDQVTIPFPTTSFTLLANVFLSDSGSTTQWNASQRVGAGTLVVSPTADWTIDVDLWKQNLTGVTGSDPTTNIHVKGTLSKC